MKLGEIKLQAVRVGFPDFFFSCDENNPESLVATIHALKRNASFSGFVEACTGAINRAFAYIEAKGLGQVSCVDYFSNLCKKRKGGYIELPMPKDATCVERVVFQNGDGRYYFTFEVEGESIITEDKEGTYTVVYRKRIPRVTSVTSDTYEVEGPEGLIEYVPYFVAAETLAAKGEGTPQTIMAVFEDMIAFMSKKGLPCQSCFETRYSLR